MGKKFSRKQSLTMPGKTEKGTHWSRISPGIVCYAEKKENLFNFSSLGQMVQFDTIKFRRISPGIVCYAEKKENLFNFSSLGQMVQFDTIKFRRNYFGQFVWIEKSQYNNRVSLHEAPTKNGCLIQPFSHKAV